MLKFVQRSLPRRRLARCCTTTTSLDVEEKVEEMTQTLVLQTNHIKSTEIEVPARYESLSRYENERTPRFTDEVRIFLISHLFDKFEIHTMVFIYT